MFFKKNRDKTRGFGKSEDEYEDDELDLEDEETEEDEPTASEDKPAGIADEPVEQLPTRDAASEKTGEPEADDADDDEIDEPETNDAEDEEERYLLALARRQRWKKNIVLIVLAAIVVAALTITIVWAVTYTDPNATALKVGDTEIALSEFEFNYFYSVDYFANQYGDQLTSAGIDLTGDLQTTPCAFDQTITWHEYFVTQAATLLQQNVALSQEAMEDGFEMTDEDMANVQAYFDSMTEYATQYGMDIDTFVKSTYGEYVSQQMIMAALARMSMAQRYSQKVISELPITDEQIEAYFTEHLTDYQTATYRMMIFSDASAEEGDDRTAQEKANEMAAAVTDEKSFIELARENAPEASKTKYEDDDYTLATGIYAGQFNETVASDWLFDAARKEGDVTVLELTSGYAVTYFIGLGRDESRTVDVRHILVSVDDMEDETKVAEGKAEAERIYQLWKDGDANETYFGALAKEYSKDSNATAGGLYESVTVGQMVDTFNDWCFDAARKPGDTGIVETKYGFHIMYFVEQNEATWKAGIRSALQNTAYTDYLTALVEDYPYSVYDGVAAKIRR